jgi:uncharacterized cupin superfamily protein
VSGVPPFLVHWDEVESFDVPPAVQPLGGRWQRLADAGGSVGVGLQRVRARDGQMLTPPHAHSAEEEIFHVLGGSATLWQDGMTCTVHAGDTIVHVAGGPPHTLIAGEPDVEVLVFGQRLTPEAGHLPRTGRVWLARTALDVPEDHPWRAEAELGVPDGAPAGERPRNVQPLDAAPSDYGGMARYLARGIAERSGLNRVQLPPGEEGAPPHCHSAEEEVVVVLEGEGTLELWARPDPERSRQTEPAETYAVRRGHVVVRPPGTRVPHSLRAGAAGMTYLVYGTREANDMCWYPRSNKVFLRGLGVIARLELLAYADGEPS